MIYVCKNEFHINKIDNDGCIVDKYLKISKETKWVKHRDWMYGIQKIHLGGKNSRWIEITEDRFKKYFEEQEYNLILNVRKEYFDEVKSGKKKYEYRLFNDYWKKKIWFVDWIDNVIIKLGYPKNIETEKIIKFKYQGYEIETIKHKEFGDKPVKVFAIKLEGVKI
ncbi:hypothetical protein [Fusobacterium sp. IOR10]|uniref:hypothetical protein n=1 Tax=Fusobacterium sp. IOR10 TaxID=2665157 RepID=UPI001EF08329|nr:hypothetical protein [Fusobacterium sp. IOR10]